MPTARKGGKRMKTNYNTPEVDVLVLQDEDILTASSYLLPEINLLG